MSCGDYSVSNETRLMYGMSMKGDKCDGYPSIILAYVWKDKGEQLNSYQDS
jgi:hypothetical protein